MKIYITVSWKDKLKFLCFLTSQYIFPYNSYIIENSKQLTIIKNFYVIVKDPLSHVSIGHKQHTEVKSKWHEQEISLDFKFGQIKFHYIVVANKFKSIKHIFIICLLCAWHCTKKNYTKISKNSHRLWNSCSVRKIITLLIV